MKTILCTEQAAKSEKLTRLEQALGDIGLPTGQNAARAEELVIQLLQKSLDNRFFCLRNTSLSNPNQPATLILVGSVGVKIIQINDSKGIFEAHESSLEELDSRTQKFKQVKPDPLVQCVEASGMLQNLLESKGVTGVKVEPFLVFVDPGAHVNASRPALKIVLSDAIDRFAVSIASMPLTLKPAVVDLIIDAICPGFSSQDYSGPALSKTAVKQKDAFSLHEEAKPKPKPLPRLNNLSIQEPGALKKIRFSKRQRAILTGLFILAITSLIILVLVMVFFS